MPVCPDCGEFHELEEEEEDDEPSSSGGSDWDMYDESPLFWDESSSDYMDDDEEEEDDDMPFPFMPPFHNPMTPSPILFPPFDLFHFHVFHQMVGMYREIERQKRKRTRDEEWHRKKQLGMIHKFEYSSKNPLNERNCVICLVELEEGSKIARLKCNHHYHLECIQKWLLKTGKCPLCMTKVLSTLAEAEVVQRRAGRLRREAHRRMRSKKERDEARKKYIDWRRSLVKEKDKDKDSHEVHKVVQEKKKRRLNSTSRWRKK